MPYTDQIKEFIIDNFLFGDANGFDDETSFFEEGILDSTGILELIGFIEKEFNIKVADNELTPDIFYNIKTVGAYVKDKIAAG